MRVDWDKVRHEYVTTGASQRDLSKKYGVSKTAIQRRAKDEKWLDKRDQFVTRMNAKVVQRTESIVIDQTERLYLATDKLLNKVFQLLDMDDALAPRDLKSLSSTLTDIKMLRAKDDSEVTALENQITVKFVGNDWDGDPDA